MTKRKPEVLVVGAGPVGLFTALVLANRGIGVQIVDKEWRRGVHSYALALHPNSLRLLQENGLSEALFSCGYPVNMIGFYEGETRHAEVRVTGDTGLAPGILVLRQHDLERLLEEALTRHGVRVQWNHRVTQIEMQSDGVAVTIDKLVKETVGYAVMHTEWVIAKTYDRKVPFVIGTDGYRSTVRRSLGIQFAKAAPAQSFAVFEFRSNRDAKNEMSLVLDETTTNVLWPLPGSCFRWSFQVDGGDAVASTRDKDRVGVQLGAARFPILEENSLRKFIAERSPWFDGTIDTIIWRILVQFESRLAESFGRDRMWLAGDAGHLTGPAGMQSMNVGLREGWELAGTIADCLRNGGSIDRLEAYSRDRTTEWRSLLGTDGGLQSEDDSNPWLSARAKRLLPCLPASGHELDQFAKQLNLKRT